MIPPHPPSWSRRTWLKHLSAALAAPSLLRPAAAAPSTPPSTPPVGGAATRALWIQHATRLATPVLGALAKRELHLQLPKERLNSFAGLEALGRLLAGIAPWLEQDQPAELTRMARAALDAATDPASPDFLNYSRGSQPLVDAAFLAHALIRAPKTLWEPLEPRVKKNLLAALQATRRIQPGMNNWLLFAAMVEAAIHRFGAGAIDRKRVQTAIDKHMEWYLGDGIYGDGPQFHWDHYNSYVIQPMLHEVVRTLGPLDKDWGSHAPEILKRLRRYAAVQERMISPEGTFPVIGRSSVYRCGALQGLAQAALLGELPRQVTPAQARCALTASIRRVLEFPGTFDDRGWLTIGFCGHQPAMADSYISCGSVYLASFALLPLGLPATDRFWTDPDEPWTAVRIWSGADVPGDHAI